ncbi:MAG TPA: hypothetical protein VJU59_44240 [Paraburkholderia sp.]|jgi:hypothetical protein|uniref:hypothetical protein n=1 Tax=Paraburkholderia sp. TaxID=1926495 RepID=UPI002B482B1A|nr:hypothetical protein [Paraburkholderia sp.]HKR46602.1 hypothetical protein [Paraburkholderia sp.]
MKRRKRPSPLPDETSSELQARLRRFALATREEALRPATVPFPEHVTVLAGPLRKVRTKTADARDESEQDCSSDQESDEDE